MDLTFDSAEVEATSAPPPYDLLLGVVARVRLHADDGHLVYEEELFPIVELAEALDTWLVEGRHHGVGFCFDSVESDQPGQLWCRPTSGGWLVGSAHQSAPDPTLHPTSEVTDAFSGFVRSVEAWLHQTLGRTLDDARP